MPGIKLFVDDLRRCPDGWELARTNTDAIRILHSGWVDTISIDHDIMVPEYCGDSSFAKMVVASLSDETFKPVAYYIALMGRKRPREIYFHTANIEQGHRMAEIIGVEYNHWWYDQEAKGGDNEHGSSEGEG